MTKYRTKDGDTLDAICWKHYGKQSGAVEAVLEANMRLARLGEELPAGILVTLPDLPTPEKEEGVTLW